MNCYDLLKRIMDASRMTADAKRTALKALVSEVMWHFPDGKVTEADARWQEAWGQTFNRSVDDMNPNAIAGFLIHSAVRVVTQAHDFETALSIEMDYVSRCQSNGDLTAVRGGKVGKFYPRKYADILKREVTHIAHEFGTGMTMHELKEHTLITGRMKGDPMDEFNPTDVLSQALKLATMAIEQDPYGSAKDMLDRTDDMLNSLCDEHSLNAKQRVSARAAFDLVADDIANGSGEYAMDAIKSRDIDVPSDIAMKILGETEADADVPAPTKTIDVPDIDTSVETAINALLTQATKGKMGDVKKMLTDLSMAQTMAKKLEDEVSVLKSRAMTAPVMTASADVEVDGSTLTYKVVMTKASELFKNPITGKKHNELSFELPTLVWTDKDGNEVRHPQCPDVDPNYVIRAMHLLKLCTAFLKGKNVFAHGHTGSGKTTLYEQFFARLGMPVFRVNLDSALERADLVGNITLANDGGTTVSKFEEGVLPRVMTQPCALILDEFDAGRADLLFVIQRASEGKGLMLTEDGGRIVTPHPLFRFCATANSRGQGDEHGIYAGVRPINGALLDRFPVFIEVDYLTEKEEGTVLKKNFPEVADETRTHLVQFAQSMRKAFTTGEITVPCSPRGLQSICEMIPFFDNILPTNAKAIEMAIETAIIDRAPVDNRQRIIEIADKHFPNCKFL